MNRTGLIFRLMDETASFEEFLYILPEYGLTIEEVDKAIEDFANDENNFSGVRVFPPNYLLVFHQK